MKMIHFETIDKIHDDAIGMDAKIRSYAREVFHDYKKIESDGFFWKDVVEHVEVIIGRDKFSQKWSYGSELQKAIGVFFRELIECIFEIEEKNDLSELFEVLSAIERGFFMSSPSLSTFLSEKDKLFFYGKFVQLPRGSRIGSDLIGELVLKFAFSSKSAVENFINNFFTTEVVGASCVDQLVFVETMRAFATSDINRGYDARLDIYPIVTETLHRLADTTEYPLVILKIDDVLNLIRISEVQAFDLELDEEEENELTDYFIEIRKIKEQRIKGDLLAAKLKGDFDINNFYSVSSDYVIGYDRGVSEIAHKSDMQFMPIQVALRDPRVLPYGTESLGRHAAYLFTIFNDGLVSRNIKDTLGISIEKLPMRSQLAFVEYLSSAKKDDFEKIKSYITDFGIDGNLIANVLFGAHDSKEMARVVLDFIETHGKDAVPVLQKYSESLHRIDSVQEEISSVYKKSVDTRLVVQEFVKRLDGLFFTAIKNVDVGIFSEIDKDITLFLSVFRAATKQSGASFEDFVGLALEKKESHDIAEKEKKEMITIARANWLVRGFVGGQVVKGFEEKLQSGSDAEWRMLKKFDEIIAFVRFDSMPDDEEGRSHKTAASLNVHPQYRGSSIGEVVILKSLVQEAEQSVLHGTMDPRIDVGTRYVEDVGFLVTGVAESFLETKESFFEITADIDRLKKFQTRSWTHEQLLIFGRERLTVSVDAQMARADIVVANVTRESGQEPRFIHDAKRLIDEGFIGTRYIKDPDRDGVRYMVFERLV